MYFQKPGSGRIRSTLFLYLGLLTCLTMSSITNGAPLDVTETSDFHTGPYPRHGFTHVGTLDIGLNQIRGSIFESDRDAVQVTLPAGLQIDSIDLTVSNHIDSNLGRVGTSSFIALANLGAGVNGIGGGVNDEGTKTIANGPFTLPGGHILFTYLSGGPTTNASSDWLYQIEVSSDASVPEPASISLLGLGSLLLLRRRGRHRLRKAIQVRH